MCACKHLFTKIYLNMHVNAAESAFGRRHTFMQAEKDNERQNEEFKKRRRGIKSVQASLGTSWKDNLMGS